MMPRTLLRILPRMLAALACASVVILILDVAMWIRSGWVCDWVAVTTVDASKDTVVERDLSSARGTVIVRRNKHESAHDLVSVTTVRGTVWRRESRTVKDREFELSYREMTSNASNLGGRTLVTQTKKIDGTWMAIPYSTFAIIPAAVIAACVVVRLIRRRTAGLCRECGYDLTGNVSGKCPECGLKIHRAVPR
jgi:hypothetical protein